MKSKGSSLGLTIRAMPPSENLIFSANSMCTQLKAISGRPVRKTLSSAQGIDALACCCVAAACSTRLLTNKYGNEDQVLADVFHMYSLSWDEYLQADTLIAVKDQTFCRFADPGCHDCCPWTYCISARGPIYCTLPSGAIYSNSLCYMRRMIKRGELFPIYYSFLRCSCYLTCCNVVEGVIPQQQVVELADSLACKPPPTLQCRPKWCASQTQRVTLEVHSQACKTFTGCAVQ